MDEVFVRREVIDAPTLRGLCVPSDFKGALQTLSHVGLAVVVGTALWFLRATWWAVPLFALQGVILNFLYAGQHELSHWTVFRTRWLNEWVGRLFGFVLFYPRTFDQVQHVAHHRFTQDWQRDGELARPRYDMASYLWWMSGITYWYTRWRRILRFCFGVVTEPYLPAARRSELILEARLHLFGYLLIAAISIVLRTPLVLTVWLAPMLVMKFTHQLQNTIEHLGLPHADDVLNNTRSTRTNAIVRWLAWQMPYHTAHHAFPGVPFHRLARLHDLIFTQRGAVPPTMSYWGFQVAVVRAFSRGRTEADYADEAAWIRD